MSIETMINIVGVAISIGSFVPLMYFKDRRREVAVTAIASAVCVFTVLHLYQNYKYDCEFRYVRNELLSTLADKDCTYEDLRQPLGDVSAPMLADVIQNMLRKKEIYSIVVPLHDMNGQNFGVRLYKVERIFK